MIFKTHRLIIAALVWTYYLVFHYRRPVLFPEQCSVCWVLSFFLVSSRLFRNSRSTDLRSPCLPSRENQTVPDADAGTYLRPGFHCLCPYFWSFRHSSEIQAMKMDHSLYPESDQPDLEADWSVWMNWIMYHVLHCSDTSVKSSTIYCCLKTVNGSRWYILQQQSIIGSSSHQVTRLDFTDYVLK